MLVAMILTLRLPRERRMLDAPDGIEFRSLELRVVNQVEPVASFHVAAWQHAWQRCSYIECRAALWLYFLESGRLGPVLGPFASVRLRDLHLFAGRQRAAKLSLINGHWIHDGTDESWPVLRVLPSAPVPLRAGDRGIMTI
jgi:hypothetical protein